MFRWRFRFVSYVGELFRLVVSVLWVRLGFSLAGLVGLLDGFGLQVCLIGLVGGLS